MKCLISGCGGSIGVHVLAHIMKNTDWEIVGIDSFRHKGNMGRIVAALEDYPDWRKRIKIITHDLVAPLSAQEVKRIGEIDYIINLASLCDVWDSVADPVPFIRNNVELVMTMLELARQIKPKAFVQFSTDEVYGPAIKGHKEWDALLPSNPYAGSKAAQEVIAISYWRSYGVPLIITNTMNNFGSYQGPTKYPVIIQKKLMVGETIDVHTAKDGTIGSRYYIHSRNAADALLFILERPVYLHKAGEIDKPDRYNIVGDVRLDNLQLARKIARLMDKKLKYRLVDFHSKEPGHDLSYGLDGSKLAKLGWKSPISFEESMAQTIKWQMEHEDWIT